MGPTVVAHAGHILIDGPLFLSPLLMLGAALWISARRHQREGSE